MKQPRSVFSAKLSDIKSKISVKFYKDSPLQFSYKQELKFQENLKLESKFHSVNSKLNQKKKTEPAKSFGPKVLQMHVFFIKI